MILRFIQRCRAVTALFVINVTIFFVAALMIGTFKELQWSFGLLELGALFNPFALGGEWWRIFTHIFLHGHFFHLAVNMVALVLVGAETERSVGAVKFLAVYVVAAAGAAVASLYFNLFVIGVGASGAIFGIFGFALIMNIFSLREEGESALPTIINFVVFLILNLFFGAALKADMAAHLGGLAVGLVIGGYSFLFNRSFSKVSAEPFVLAIVALVFILLPRYQRAYYQFYQDLLSAEAVDASSGNFNSDADYLNHFRSMNARWDSIAMALDAVDFLPPELHSDTAILRQYMTLQKRSNDYRIRMIERESYVYLDSVQVVQQQAAMLGKLEYPLSFRMGTETKEDPVEEPALVQVWYDSSWIEVAAPPAPYYRLGSRDSARRWNGRVEDYYALTGAIQMKGTYKNDRRDGIFLYYSDHNTYTSAGRYIDNRSVGKWEYYHHNGRLASEVYFNDRYFLRNLWDSLGNLQVHDGEGRERVLWPNGVVKLEGLYKNGNREGYWFGHYEDGRLKFQENYHHGALTKGRSFGRRGEMFNYDQSSLFPLPEGGEARYHTYLAESAASYGAGEAGSVRLSFRVTADGRLADFLIEKSVSPLRDQQAIDIIKDGPSWLPAREHGMTPVDGVVYLSVNFSE